ncbi:MAG: tetratricopeptide repeat protein [Desulfobaccales bacterium]
MKKIICGIAIALSLAGLLLGTVLAANQPEAVPGAFAEGVAALNRNDPAAAIDKFTEALKLDPNLAEAYLNRGVAHLRLDQPVEAVADFDKVLELDPTSSEALYNRALAYSRSRVYDKALADYTQALKFAPGDWQILYNRGNTYLDLGKAKEALADYDRALQVHPKTPEILYNRGLAHLRLGQAEKALQDADTVQGLDAGFARTQVLRAQALEKLDDKYEAMAAYRQFLKSGDPAKDRTLMQQALERLKQLEGK